MTTTITKGYISHKPERGWRPKEIKEFNDEEWEDETMTRIGKEDIAEVHDWGVKVVLDVGTSYRSIKYFPWSSIHHVSVYEEVVY